MKHVYTTGFDMSGRERKVKRESYHPADICVEYFCSNKIELGLRLKLHRTDTSSVQLQAHTTRQPVQGYLLRILQAAARSSTLFTYVQLRDFFGQLSSHSLLQWSQTDNLKLITNPITGKCHKMLLKMDRC